MNCKQCGEHRTILNKDSICVYCLYPPKKGTDVKNNVVNRTGLGVEVKSR